VAQNLFEPTPSGPVIRGSTEQGDGDQDGLKIVLTSAPVPARTKAESHKGKWMVQVGAFKSKSDAKEQLALVSKRFGKHFRAGDGEVSGKSGSYRARFSGYTEASAKDACKALKAKRLACMVIKPA